MNGRRRIAVWAMAALSVAGCDGGSGSGFEGAPALSSDSAPAPDSGPVAGLPPGGDPASIPCASVAPTPIQALPPETGAVLHGVVADFGSRGEGTAGEPTWGHNTGKIALHDGSVYFVFLSREGDAISQEGWSHRLGRLDPDSGVVEFGYCQTFEVLQPGTLIIDRHGYVHLFDFGAVPGGYGVRHVMTVSPVAAGGFNAPSVAKGFLGPGVFGYIGVAYDAASHRVFVAYGEYAGNQIELKLTRAALAADANGAVAWSAPVTVAVGAPGLAPTYTYVVPLGGDRVALAYLSAVLGGFHYRDARFRVITNVETGEGSTEIVLATLPVSSAPSENLDIADVHLDGDRVRILLKRSFAHGGQPARTIFETIVSPPYEGAAVVSAEEPIRDLTDGHAYRAAKLAATPTGFKCAMLTLGEPGGERLVVYSRDTSTGVGWTRESVLQPIVDPRTGDIESPSHLAARKPWWGGEAGGPADFLYGSITPRSHPVLGAPVHNVWFVRLDP